MLGSVFPIQAFSDQKSPLYLVCTLRYMQSEQRLGGVFEIHANKSLSYCENNIGRTIDVRGDSSKDSERKEESLRGSLSS